MLWLVLNLILGVIVLVWVLVVTPIHAYTHVPISAAVSDTANVHAHHADLVGNTSHLLIPFLLNLFLIIVPHVPRSGSCITLTYIMYVLQVFDLFVVSFCTFCTFGSPHGVGLVNWLSLCFLDGFLSG